MIERKGAPWNLIRSYNDPNIGILYEMDENGFVKGMNAKVYVENGLYIWYSLGNHEKFTLSMISVKRRF